MVKRSHTCLQWLMRVVAEVAPCPGAMGNNTIKTHLVLHLCEDILDHGVPDNVNSAYAESAHIPLAKATSRNTQKRAISFTKQAANRYTENLVISLASTDVENDVKRNVDSSAADVDTPLSDGKGGRRFYLAWEEGNERATFRWTRPRSGDNLEMAHLSHRVTAFLSRHCLPKMPKGRAPMLHVLQRRGRQQLPRPSLLRRQGMERLRDDRVGRVPTTRTGVHPHVR
ncbi:hypothetical protein MHU86_19380 [Fragilaria crotonensis]|nr:hypothetical protein MHU86_19380 [Fragilaria crotonensis]